MNYPQIVCSTLTFSEAMGLTGVFDAASGVSRWIICHLFSTNTLYIVPVYASQAGLVVITAERYAKIVHPIGHRKHFRSWMVKVGLAVPWLVGVTLYLIPNWATTRMIDGRCRSFSDWAVKNMFQAYTGQLTLSTLMPFCRLTKPASRAVFV